jgi:polysaccharide export outer membrane protein
MRKFFPLIVVPLCMLSCVNSKQLSYFQDLSDTARKHLVDMAPFQPLRLQADDQVQINISSISPEASQFFNQLMQTPTAGVGVSGGQTFQNNYSVNQEGFISLPMLGDLSVKGMATEELRIKIKGMLKDYLKEPVVTVKLVNFRVTVIGEVGGPQVVPVQGERINVLEALGAAGDMTVYAKRYNVKVVRQNEGKMEVSHLDFNSSKAIQSPYFQLKQNDVVYVEPNKNKALMTETWVTLVPLLTSIVFAFSIILNAIVR